MPQYGRLQDFYPGKFANKLCRELKVGYKNTPYLKMEDFVPGDFAKTFSRDLRRGYRILHVESCEILFRVSVRKLFPES